MLFASLTGDVMLDILIGALVTITVYSSLAVVLLVATFASLGLIGLPVAIGLVLGANLGSGLLAMLSTLHAEPEARRVTLGNFLFKVIGVAIAIPLVHFAGLLVERANVSPAHEVVLFHLAFNAVLAIVFVGLHRAHRALLRAAAAGAAAHRERRAAAPPRSVGARDAGARDRQRRARGVAHRRRRSRRCCAAC